MNRNPKNILFLSIALTCALSITSCSKDQAEIERPEKVYYDQAQRRIKVNNYFGAIESLQRIETQYPFGKYAEQAQVELIYANFMNSDNEASHAAAEKFIRLQNSFTGNLAGASLKTYNNISVRQGQTVTNVRKHADGYLTHIENHFNKLQDKVKTSGAKDKIERNKKKLEKLADQLLKNEVIFKNDLVDIFGERKWLSYEEEQLKKTKKK